MIMNSLLQSALIALALTLAYSNPLAAQMVREANTTLKMPANLPQSTWKKVDALPGLIFSQPMSVVSVPGVTNAIFVVERHGRIQKVTNHRSANPTKSLFMDITDRVGSTGSEEGLLGMAFHPNYNANGYFYVFYTTKSPRKDVIARFSRNNESQGNPSSELQLIAQNDESTNHNGGDMHFGPDGYLYVSLGDEGGSNDSFQNSQRIDKDFFAGLIRIDVDRKSGNVEPNSHPAVVMNGSVANYKVPSDNPFRGATSFNGLPVNPASVRTEFWAVGLRNPWRMGFDPLDGRLFVGDVGQGAREEVDLIVKGGNYGWNYREGTIARPGSPTPPAGFSAIDPIYDYPRTEGYIVIGGFVYRGSRFPELYGQYIFADAGSGKLMSLKQQGSTWAREFLIGTGVHPSAVVSDPANGDVLLVDNYGGFIHRLERNTTTGTPLPTQLSDTGAFSSLATLTPHAGIEGFAPAINFWSDHAVKTRWFSIPNVNDKMAFSTNGNWTFPTNTVWIKHFDLPLDRRNTNSMRRIETRFLIKNAEGVYGVTYRWDNAQTNATLVAEQGMDENFTIIDENGVQKTQTWRYPSRSECLACHTTVGGHALGFNTRQLNSNFKHGAVTTNQLISLKNAGYFSNAVPNPSTLPTLARADDESQSLLFRARTYLDVNCSQCHQPGGPTPSNWDAKISRNFKSAGILYGSVANNGGVSSRKVMVPGSTNLSVLIHRVAATGGFSRMPPVGSKELDQAGINLLRRWVLDESKLGYYRAVNAGGPSTGGFHADAGFSGGRVHSTTNSIVTAGIAYAGPEAIYKTERWQNFNYTFGGLNPGSDYEVLLHFAEIALNGPNLRVFDVRLNGQLVLDDFDIFAQAGGFCRALVKRFVIKADSKGLIRVTSSATKNSPKFSAFEITEFRDSLLAVNSAGIAEHGFIADTGLFTGSTSINSTTSKINLNNQPNVAPMAIYQRFRRGAHTYNLTGFQPGQTYRVLLHFVERSFTSANQRQFDVKINGQLKLDNLDIFAEAGGKDRALVKEVQAAADATGKLAIQLVNQINSAQICGLEIRE
jgi:uncharacterized repeat protein (TIGR03806 family)